MIARPGHEFDAERPAPADPCRPLTCRPHRLLSLSLLGSSFGSRRPPAAWPGGHMSRDPGRTGPDGTPASGLGGPGRRPWPTDDWVRGTPAARQRKSPGTSTAAAARRSSPVATAGRSTDIRIEHECSAAEHSSQRLTRMPASAAFSVVA